jgi:hypothetical protein
MSKTTKVIIGLSVFAVFFFLIGLWLGTDLFRGKTEVALNAKEAPKEEKIFYLIRSEAYPSMEGGANIMLDYSCNGLVQTQAVFESTEQRDAYIKHLEAIGKVVNKGGID